MGDLLAYHAERDPQRVAVQFQDDAITYGALDRWANGLARAYADRGVGFGDLVNDRAAQRDRVLRRLVRGLQARCDSAAAAPPAAAHPNVTVSSTSANPRWLSASSPRRAAVVRRCRVASSRRADTLDTPVAAVVGPSFKAMASGGSTGRPKLIVAKVPAEFDPETPAVQMQPGDVQLVPGPLYHNGPYSFSMFDLFVGGTLVVMERFDAAEALRLIERYRVQWVFFVPTMMHRIWRLPDREQYDVSSLRTVFSTGAPWPIWLKEAWIGWLGPDVIREGYGGTESQGGTSITGHESLERPGSVGLPQQGALVRILDADGNEVPTGEVGEIYFMPATGPGSTYYYLGAEAKDREGWETIGDLGYVDADGYLYLVDRRTDMIVTGGANVYPAEVEAALDAHPGVRSSAVIGLPDDERGQDRARDPRRARTRSGRPRGRRAVHRRAPSLVPRERIVTYKVPRSFEFVREPLRDDAGKVRRSALRDERVATSETGGSA